MPMLTDEAKKAEVKKPSQKIEKDLVAVYNA